MSYATIPIPDGTNHIGFAVCPACQRKAPVLRTLIPAWDKNKFYLGEHPNGQGWCNTRPIAINEKEIERA